MAEPVLQAFAQTGATVDSDYYLLRLISVGYGDSIHRLPIQECVAPDCEMVSAVFDCFDGAVDAGGITKLERACQPGLYGSDLGELAHALEKMAR
jgi:hypothetical protein